MHTIRIKKDSDKVILMNRNSIISINIILIAARSKSKTEVKFFKHHELIRRILKRRMKKEEKLSIVKIVHDKNWKELQEDKINNENNNENMNKTLKIEKVKKVKQKQFRIVLNMKKKIEDITVETGL